MNWWLCILCSVDQQVVICSGFDGLCSTSAARLTCDKTWNQGDHAKDLCTYSLVTFGSNRSIKG